MRLFGGACAMSGDPHLSCYVPLGLVALMFLLVACSMAVPIVAEFRTELRWLAGLVSRARRVGLRKGRAPAPTEVVAGPGVGVARGPWPLTEERDEWPADVEKAA